MGRSSFKGAGFPEIDFKPNCTHLVYSNIFDPKIGIPRRIRDNYPLKM